MSIAALRWRNWPPFRKLAPAFVLAAVLPALVITAIDVFTLRAALVSNLEQRNLERANATAAEINHYLRGKLDTIKTVAASPSTFSFLAGPEAARRDSPLPGELAVTVRNNGFNAIVVTDRTGNAVAASESRLTGLSFAANPVFAWASGGLTTMDDPVFDTRDNQHYIYFSTPVLSAPGTVIGRITTATIDTAVNRDSNYAGHNEYGILWNEHGIRISQPYSESLRFHPLAPLPPAVTAELTATQRYGPATADILKNAGRHSSLAERSTAVLNNTSASPVIEAVFDNGEPSLVCITRINTRRWLYGVVAPMSVVNAAVQSAFLRSMLVTLVAGALALSAAWVLARVRRTPPAAGETTEIPVLVPAAQTVAHTSVPETAAVSQETPGQSPETKPADVPSSPPVEEPDLRKPADDTATATPAEPQKAPPEPENEKLPHLDTGASTLTAAPARDVLPGPPPALQLNAPPTDVRNRETALEVPPPAAPIELPEKTPAPVPETAPVNHAEATATVSADAPGTPEAISEPEPEDKPPEKPGRRSGWSGPMALPPV